MKLKDKVAIVTGSTKGIGYAIADLYLSEGAKVVVCGLEGEVSEAVESLSKKHDSTCILGMGLDLTSTESINALVEGTVEHFGTVDILVNNAGITVTRSVLESSDEEFERVMDINLFGMFKTIRAVGNIMKDNGGGSIINTSSMVSIYSSPNQSAYSSSKFAVNGLTKSCARELGKYNIRVNAVAPGVVGTDMVKENVSDQMLEGLKRVTALGRMAEPRELAGAYLYLASDDASFTTGAILQVDGGIVM